MVDLHTHILPCVDDGPDCVQEAVKLIGMELECGVEVVAATPHFIPDISDNVTEFAEKRRRSAETLREELDRQSIKIEIIEGAEVALNADLPYLKDIERLKYAGTDYMLIELPRLFYYDWIPEALYNLQLSGIIPVLAHVERFPYIQAKPEILYELVEAGCLTQINATFLLKSGHTGLQYISKLMKRNLIHLIASDTHSVRHRPPLLDDAIEVIGRKWGRSTAHYFRANAAAIAAGQHAVTKVPLKTSNPFGFLKRN